MSKDSLPIYLRDHLAGAAAAIEILDALRDGHAGEPLGRFAEGLSIDIDLDRRTLEALAERVGSGSSVLKETTAWLGAKLARFKLGPSSSADLGTLEALETWRSESLASRPSGRLSRRWPRRMLVWTASIWTT